MENQVLKEHAVEAILSEIERMDELAYEQFVDGHLSTDGLETVYNGIREWSRVSEQLLKMLGEQKDREP